MLIVTDAADDVPPVLDFSGRAGHVLRAFPKALVGTRFCGAYTTFSTITNEAPRLVGNGELLQAAANVVGLAAAAAGVALGLAA